MKGVSIINKNIKVKVADTFLKRLCGLIFLKQLKIDECLLITRCNSVHTFFMRYPIDLIFLDADNRILKIIENAKPYRPFFYCPGSVSVIEAKNGFIKQNAIDQSSSIRINSRHLFIDLPA